jgi:hypothetical protein
VHHVKEGEGRRGGLVVTAGGLGQPAMTPDCRERAAPCRAHRGAWGLTGGPWPQCWAATPTDRPGGAVLGSNKF